MLFTLSFHGGWRHRDGVANVRTRQGAHSLTPTPAHQPMPCLEVTWQDHGVRRYIHPWRAQKCSSPGTVGLEENKSKHVSGRKVYCLWAFPIPRAHSITAGLWKDPRFAKMLVSTMCLTEKRQLYRDCPARIASPGCEPACGKGATWQASV